MDPKRKQRLRELQEHFIIHEEYGDTPVWDILADTLADYLNRKYGRQVVVPRERRTPGGR